MTADAHRPLDEGEAVLAEFAPDRATYWRDHAWMSALAMAGGMAVLWAIGNPHVWAGAVGGLAAVAIRAWYLESEEMAVRWLLTDRRLLGPGGRAVRLAEIATLRSLGSAVQVVTAAGDKHLLKYQSDRDATLARLRQAGAGRGA
ncbi:hypothetical protein [Roseovarius salis]|uniref:hypothetical protein n=1 Tax=Roseovarius salis TaxID=3376063 RepID=UPI0037C94038